MLRKVIKTETYQPSRTRPPAFGIADTLECGHTVHNKGSAGFANRRRCADCANLKKGHETGTRKIWVGGVRVLWNPETEMPYMEDGSPVR